jgi:hypothetical protein
VETSAALPVVAKALDAHLSFFPDGRRIAYTGLIDPGEAARLLREHGAAPEAFGKGLMSWPRLRAACILDLDTGRVEAIFPGGSVLVSPGGTKMLVQGEDAALRLVDLAERRSQPAALPGLVRWWYHDALVAFVDADRVLYRALPTEGVGPKWTTSNSPLVGPKPMLSVKIARLSTGEFQTVVPYLDPRDGVSFGPWVYGRSYGNEKPRSATARISSSVIDPFAAAPDWSASTNSR